MRARSVRSATRRAFAGFDVTTPARCYSRAQSDRMRRLCTELRRAPNPRAGAARSNGTWSHVTPRSAHPGPHISAFAISVRMGRGSADVPNSAAGIPEPERAQEPQHEQTGGGEAHVGDDRHICRHESLERDDDQCERRPRSPDDGANDDAPLRMRVCPQASGDSVDDATKHEGERGVSEGMAGGGSRFTCVERRWLTTVVEEEERRGRRVWRVRLGVGTAAAARLATATAARVARRTTRTRRRVRAPTIVVCRQIRPTLPPPRGGRRRSGGGGGGEGGGGGAAPRGGGVSPKWRRTSAGAESYEITPLEPAQRGRTPRHATRLTPRLVPYPSSLCRYEIILNEDGAVVGQIISDGVAEVWSARRRRCRTVVAGAPSGVVGVGEAEKYNISDCARGRRRARLRGRGSHAIGVERSMDSRAILRPTSLF